ncbi:hypothetical protein H0H81_000056 [Sphagnurus paluster]|uniref:Thioester reductase (TE) domain-containing protein n=1 Tax=Sphagnurus paluster TaxID=117069 RepID=A0A9P7K642_9AGAR|nr:hypothetical protein H0H81_000056 [Sphagnurus paluster]
MAQRTPPPANWNLAEVELWIISQAKQLANQSDISPSIDLFSQGFNSTSAVLLHLRIIDALRSSGAAGIESATRALSHNLVYSYPVIQDLAAYVVSFAASPEDAQREHVSWRTAQMEAIIEKYTKGLQRNYGSSGYPPTTAPVVLLAGSTGNLGVHILAKLLQDSRVEQVLVTNLPVKGTQTVKEQHIKEFEDSGLDPTLLESEKLIFLRGDISQSNLGLDRGQYGLVCRSVNIVIHNAWLPELNLTPVAFELLIQGMRHLIDIVKTGANASTARFVFVSSVIAVQSWDASRGLVPEDVVDDASVAVGLGYGEAKYVAERVVAKSGLSSISVRVDYISEAQITITSPTKEWFPILLKSSITLGSLPQANEVAPLTSVEDTATSIVNVALHHTALPRALNLVHHHPKMWNDVIKQLQSLIKESTGKDLTLVPFEEWMVKIEELAAGATAQTLETIPALEILEFFRGALRGTGVGPLSAGPASFTTTEAQRVSDVTAATD